MVALPAPVSNPVLQLTDEQLRRSKALSKRASRVHRFCELVNTAGSTPGVPRLARRAASKGARRLAEVLLPSLDEPLLTPTIYGFDLCVSRRSGKNYYYEGFFETGTLDVMRRLLRPGDVFVDAGASVGLMSIMASRLLGHEGQVLAFEPHCDRFVELTNSVAANQAANVRCFPCGLSDEPAEVPLYSDRVSPSMIEAADSSDAGDLAQVVRLDDVIAHCAVGPVRMVKVDVEGFELQVLQGAVELLTGDAPPVLCIEYGVYDEHPFVPFLEGLDRYRLFQLHRTKDYRSRLRAVPDVRDLRQHDNVFAFPEGITL